MKILLLPGASDSNRAWSDVWAKALSDNGHDVKEFYYDHWGKEEMFSLEKESLKLSSLEDSWRDGAIVIAKSVGTVLCVYAVNRKIISPCSALFMGFPTDIQDQKDATIIMDINGWLADYNVQTQIFQNENDPVTSYEHMRRFVEDNKFIKTVSVPGDTHKYLPQVYLEKVLNLLK